MERTVLLAEIRPAVKCDLIMRVLVSAKVSSWLESNISEQDYAVVRK